MCTHIKPIIVIANFGNVLKDKSIRFLLLFMYQLHFIDAIEIGLGVDEKILQLG